MTRQHAQHAPHHPVRGGFGVAFLSFLEYQGLTDAVVELRDPVLEGDALSYQVTVLEGKIPSNAGLASLFIDIIGMPLTPLSFAGARRRMWRRAVFR